MPAFILFVSTLMQAAGKSFQHGRASLAACLGQEENTPALYFAKESR
jgi:hypothetical protein